MTSDCVGFSIKIENQIVWAPLSQLKTRLYGFYYSNWKPDWVSFTSPIENPIVWVLIHIINHHQCDEGPLIRELLWFQTWTMTLNW